MDVHSLVHQAVDRQAQPQSEGGNSFRTLSEEMILNIFTFLRTDELPAVHLVCRQFCREGRDHTLVREDFEACKEWVTQVFEGTPYQATMQAELRALELLWHANPWGVLQGIAREVTDLLEKMTTAELVSLNIPQLDLSKTPLIEKFMHNRFCQGWKKKVVFDSIHQGQVDIQWGWSFTDSAFQLFLRALGESREITSLAINDVLPVQQATLFARAITTKQMALQELVLDPEPQIAPQEMEVIFQALANMTELKALRIRRSSVNDAAIAVLRDVLAQNCTIEEIALEDYNFTRIGMEMLMQIAVEHPTLTTLRLKQFTSSDIPIIAQYLPRTHIHTLTLDEGPLTDAEAQLLEEVAATSQPHKELRLLHTR